MSSIQQIEQDIYTSHPPDLQNKSTFPSHSLREGILDINCRPSHENKKAHTTTHPKQKVQKLKATSTYQNKLVMRKKKGSLSFILYLDKWLFFPTRPTNIYFLLMLLQFLSRSTHQRSEKTQKNRHKQASNIKKRNHLQKQHHRQMSSLLPWFWEMKRGVQLERQLIIQKKNHDNF